MDISNIWKLNVSELCEIVHRYEKYASNLKKKYLETLEESKAYSEKSEMIDKERKRLLQEIEEINVKLLNF